MIKRWAPLLILLLSLTYLSGGLSLPLNHLDEGLVDVGAEQVLLGGVPHRDFWTPYPPGQFYLTAAAFKVFGRSVIAARLAEVLVLGGLMLVLFLMTRHLAGEGPAWAGWGLALLWRHWPPLPIALHTVMLPCVASLLCFMLFLHPPSLKLRGASRSGHPPAPKLQATRWLVAAGALAGLALLFRQDLGLYTLMAEIGVLVAYVIRERRNWRLFLALLLPVLAVVLPVAGYLLAHVPGRELLFDYYTYPFKIYVGGEHVPFPLPWSGPRALDLAKLRDLWPYYFPVLLWLLALAGLVRHWRRGVAPEEAGRLWSEVLLLGAGLLYFNYVRVRADAWHLWPCGLLGGVLLGVVLGRLGGYRGKRRGARAAGLALLGLGALAIMAPQAVSWGQWLSYTRNHSLAAEFALPPALGIVMGPGDQGYQRAVAWVRDNVPPQESLFVTHYRNDKFSTSDTMFYFLAQRPIPTRYCLMGLGVTTTAAGQEEMIRDLEAHGTRYVVVDYLDTVYDYQMKATEPGSTLLDEYLAAHFRTARVFPSENLWKGYGILVRKDSGPAGSPVTAPSP